MKMNNTKKINISNEDMKVLRKLKNELLTDKNATFRSYSKCNNILREYANKYKTSTNTLLHLIS